MRKITISVTYDVKWSVKDHSHYIVTPCGKVINERTGKILKRIMNGGSIGYCIESKFYTLKTLRTMLEKIENVSVPF